MESIGRVECKLSGERDRMGKEWKRDGSHRMSRKGNEEGWITTKGRERARTSS